MVNWFSLNTIKSAKEILNEANTLFPNTTWVRQPSFTIDGKFYTTNELMHEFITLKDTLKSIEEDGTEEYNNAVELRKENAELMKKVIFYKRQEEFHIKNIEKLIDEKHEFLKEIKNLNHLKEENVQLMGKINKLIEDGTRVCVENASLKGYKDEANSDNKLLQENITLREINHLKDSEINELKQDLHDVKMENNSLRIFPIIDSEDIRLKKFEGTASAQYNTMENVKDNGWKQAIVNLSVRLSKLEDNLNK